MGSAGIHDESSPVRAVLSRSARAHAECYAAQSGWTCQARGKGKRGLFFTLAAPSVLPLRGAVARPQCVTRQVKLIRRQPPSLDLAQVSSPFTHSVQWLRR
jgi:hypothetical protein